ncbi:MAG TPA: tRNA (5-methylaminomethyl-2-thiouridine)(34)-methyltransferase MnmD [Bacteroidales bacterium]|nr:tRNA (5-methylaminomethyl-2-thiouridine)(34)-methyltransferase MnmD [Bacteroidales bacterium]HPS18322.1 tRNA (5-methylaminomethyl-2-thiouridine)(34)-methyltransferase MnmD [Bacteroidales bacterium]
MNVELEITEDGSHTLSVPGLKEHYHSVHGAISESQHIFINAGLKHVPENKKTISILEIGFGTGLNALLTFLETSGKKINCNYTSIELYPLDEKIFTSLNYPSLLGIEENIFLQLHRCKWNEEIKISEYFSLNKKNISADKIDEASSFFDLVYFDAFAPDIQPEMWTEEIFRKLFECMKTGAVLATYSTKGNVKRILKGVGFAIEKLPGPKGKREILRAVKK